MNLFFYSRCYSSSVRNIGYSSTRNIGYNLSVGDTANIKLYSTNRTRNLTSSVESFFGPETEKQFLLRKGFKATFENFQIFLNNVTEESKLYYNYYYKYSRLKNPSFCFIRNKEGIYMFTNKITKKSYIGKSNDLVRRLMVDYKNDPSSTLITSPFHRTLHKFGLVN